jgi:tetratricopeptide (TPR) repeat protein
VSSVGRGAGDAQAQGRTHEDVAQTLNNLAGVLSQMGDDRAAEVAPLYKRAIGIYERATENRQRELARTVNNLGVFLKQQGELTKAEEMYRRTLAIHEKVQKRSRSLVQPARARSTRCSAPVRRDVGSLRAQLDVFGLCGPPSSEVPHLLTSFTACPQELGPDHVEVAEDLSNLGTLMREMGRLPAAVELLRRALLLNRAALGAAHPTVALDLDALGAVLQEQGQLREAESYYAKALEITDLDTPGTRPLAVRRMQVRFCVLARPSYVYLLGQ